MKIPIDSIRRNPEQPRTAIDADGLQSLAQSMREAGLVQPIVVEKCGSSYILVDGERRWRAAKLLGWRKIEAHLRRDHRAGGRRLAALVANVQRTDLNPIDQAHALRAMLQELGTAAAVARKTGLGPSIVNTRLTLLTLSESVQAMFADGRLPIDNGLIFGLRRLSHAEQERITATAVTRGASGPTMIRLLNSVESGKRSARRPRQAREPEPQPEVAGGHFDALALVVGWKDLPRPIIFTARNTCRACELYAHADRKVCERCPLPAFLIRYRAERMQ
jgi:ParB family chromosome partitioning protein